MQSYDMLVTCDLTLPNQLSPLFPPATWHCTSLAPWPTLISTLIQISQIDTSTTYLGRDKSQITWHTPWFNFGTFYTHPITIQLCSQHPSYTPSLSTYSNCHMLQNKQDSSARGICIRTRLLYLFLQFLTLSVVRSDQDRSKTRTRPQSWSLAVRSPQCPKTRPDRWVWSLVFAKSLKTGPDRTAGSLVISTCRLLLYSTIVLVQSWTLTPLPHEKHPGLPRAPAQTDVSRRKAHEAREDRRSGP
jgi:hypothetical protein